MDSYTGAPPSAAQRLAEVPAAARGVAESPAEAPGIGESPAEGLKVVPCLVASRQTVHVTACALVRQLAPAERYVLRGGPEVMAAAGKGLGLAVSAIACRAATNGPAGTVGGPAVGRQSAALWLGPDEQLLLGVEGTNIAATLAPALRDLPHSLVDVSHRQTALEVSGPHATTLLNTGCPLDLDLTAFPVGMCTRTVLAKAEIVLWRTGENVFHIEVWRSFAAYVSAFLAEAAREIVPPQEISGDLIL
jgi:sarcosine oxidase subunit gamma